MNDLIVKRINKLLKEKNRNICYVSLKGGLTQSTIYDIMYKITKVAKVISIKNFAMD